MSKLAISAVSEEAKAVDPEPELLADLGLERRSDGLISWQSDSKDHPRNWTAGRKAFDTTVIIFLEFFVTVVSTAGVSTTYLGLLLYPQVTQGSAWKRN
jgi:hypothetical protein